MKPSASILVAGATGLVGGAALKLLLRDPVFSRVVVFTRRPLPPELTGSPRPRHLEEHVVDFEQLPEKTDVQPVDLVLCALGTTRRKAGSRERFHEIDFGYPLALARFGLAQGARHFLLVSALGADPESRIFYNRVKGELERAVLALPYPSVTIVRPSLLLGERKEFRLAEVIAARLAFLARGRYRPVAAAAVARVLVDAAREDRPGHRIIESDEIPRENSP